jgi:hypothetical protein
MEGQGAPRSVGTSGGAAALWEDPLGADALGADALGAAALGAAVAASARNAAIGNRRRTAAGYPPGSGPAAAPQRPLRHQKGRNLRTS